MILKFRLVHKVHNLWRLKNLINSQDRQVCLVYRQDGLQLHHQQVLEKELKQEIHRVSDYTRIRDLHRLRLNLFQYQWVMAKMMMISQHRDGGKDKGRARVSEYIFTYQCRRNHKFYLWPLQNQMMRYQTWILRLLIPNRHQLYRRIAPEEPKDLDHVTEYIHVHPHVRVHNNSLLYFLLQKYSRIRQLRKMMQIQQPWMHRIVWVIVQGHQKIKKIQGDRVHKYRRERKILPQIRRIHRRRPWRRSLWIQMKTIKTSKWDWNLFKISNYCTCTTSSSRTSSQFTRIRSQFARTSSKCLFRW